MGRNLPASKRGWGYDALRKTLDIFVDGVLTTKIGTPTVGKGDFNIYAQSTTQLHDIGTRLEVDDRVFRYCRAGSTITRMRGAFNYSAWDVTNEAPNKDAAVGATTISVVSTSATANLYKGGWVTIFSSPLQMRRITGNSISDGTDCDLYLDGGLDVAIANGTTWVTAYHNMYYDTRTASTIGAPDRDYISFVVVPLITVTSASYYWGQTWGPCYGTVESIVPGAAANSRRVCFSPNGHLWSGTTLAIGTIYSAQDAGYIIPQTSSGAGDQLYFLQLAP